MNKILTFVQKFANNWSMNLAGMMTYSLITAIIPLLVGILSIVGIVLKLVSPSEFTAVATSIGSALPAQAQKVIDMKALLKNIVNISGVAGIIALVGLLWTGSNLFTNVENAFSIAYRTRDRDFIPQRLMAIGMIILLAILLPLSLVASGLVNAGAGLFGGLLPGPLKVILTVVGPLTSIGILFLLFLAIYVIVPNIKLSFIVPPRLARRADRSGSRGDRRAHLSDLHEYISQQQPEIRWDLPLGAGTHHLPVVLQRDPNDRRAGQHPGDGVEAPALRCRAYPCRRL